MLYLEFVNELCGSFVLYYLGIYSYISDVSSSQTRTTRLSFADGTDYISTMVGTSTSGPLFRWFGFYFIFGSSACLSTLGILYLLFFVQESVTKADIAIHPAREDLTSYGVAFVHSTPEAPGCCSQLPLASDFLASFKTVLRPRPGRHQRLLILMLLFNFACYIFAYNGTEGSHRYLFASHKYGWDEQEFTVFLSVYRVLYLITLWIILPLLSKKAGVHDAWVAILACITGAIGMGFPVAFDRSWAFYAGSIIASFSPAATIVVRSMASRCVDEDEIGRVFAMISFISAISSSLISAGYQGIYSATLDVFPGAFLLVNALFFLLTIPNNLFLWKHLPRA